MLLTSLAETAASLLQCPCATLLKPQQLEPALGALQMAPLEGRDTRRRVASSREKIAGEARSGGVLRLVAVAHNLDG
jgi:hypothetical protein